MLMKAVRKGKGVPYTPLEAVEAAIKYATKAKNTKDCIYWIDRKSADVAEIKHITHEGGMWEAWIEGKVKIGRTETKSNKTFKPKLHTFKIHYKLGKNPIGLPDIEMGSPPELKLIEKNSTKMVGDFKQDQPAAIVTGEIKPKEVDTKNLVIEKVDKPVAAKSASSKTK